MIEDARSEGGRRAMIAAAPRRLARVARRFLWCSLFACAQWSWAAGDLDGYWTLDLQRSEIAIDAALLTPTAQQRVRAFSPQRHDPTTVCMPYGMPRVMTALGAYPMEIVQTPSQVTMIFDAHDEVRRIMLSERRGDQSELAPLWLGYASGAWDGDTLVVRTIGLTDQSLVDGNGVPHSSELVVTERLRRVDADTLMNELTLDDRQAFTRRVTRKLYYKRVPELQPREYHCAEQMWLEHVMSRAKALTRELAEKQQ